MKYLAIILEHANSLEFLLSLVLLNITVYTYEAFKSHVLYFSRFQCTTEINSCIQSFIYNYKSQDFIKHTNSTK